MLEADGRAEGEKEIAVVESNQSRSLTRLPARAASSPSGGSRMRKIHEYLDLTCGASDGTHTGCTGAGTRAGAELAWRTFVVPQYGTSVDYPAGIFIRAGNPEKGVGQRFESEDGRAVLSVYSRDNEDGDTPTSYLKNHLRVDRAALDYERTTRSFFAISLERDGVVYYSRCNFSGRREGAIHCFDLVYPQEEKRAWDPVVTRISLSLRPKHG